MPEIPTIQRLLAFALLAIAILYFGDGESFAWWWVALIGVTLAVLTVANAWPERGRERPDPAPTKAATFIAVNFVLPAIVVAAAAAAWVTGAASWLYAASALAAVLALAALV